MHTKPHLLLICSGLLLGGHTLTVRAQEMGDPGCDRLLLVSAFSANNVKIYDACDGEFIRNLDTNGYLEGPQAIAIEPGGDLVVVSETNGRLVRYHRDSLTYDRVIAGDRPETPAHELAPVNDPTGLVITPEGRMLVGSYSGDTVTEINPETGQAMGTVATFGRSGLRGPDAGMLLNGSTLLVPGFLSNTIVRADIDQSTADTNLVSPGAGGLSAPRQILQMANGNLLVTSWRNGKILEYDGVTGAFIRTVSAAVRGPTGAAFESSSVVLVASSADNDISRVQISDGTVLEKLITFNNGLLSSPTFILVLNKLETDLSQNQAFWTIGVGKVEDKSISVDEVFFTRGGAFGQAFDPASINTVAWGSLDIEFHSCDSGRVSWLPSQAAFDAGSYDIYRLADDPYRDNCTETGFDSVTDALWMSGIWFGGATREGEGFSVNLINGGLAIITWYTYLPAADSS